MADEVKPAATAATQTPAQQATTQAPVVVAQQAAAPAIVVQAEVKAEPAKEPAKAEPEKKKETVDEKLARLEAGTAIRDAISDGGFTVTPSLRGRLEKLYAADGAPSDVAAWLKGVAGDLGLVAGKAAPVQVKQGDSGAATNAATSALPDDIKKVSVAQWRGASDEQRRKWWHEFERKAGIGGDSRLSSKYPRSGQTARKE